MSTTWGQVTLNMSMTYSINNSGSGCSEYVVHFSSGITPVAKGSGEVRSHRVIRKSK